MSTARLKVTGHLWQGRYGSVVMDEDHLFNAIRYVTLNPVRAGLVKTAQDWPWSSARAHLAGCDDAVVKVAPVPERVGDFQHFLGTTLRNRLPTGRCGGLKRSAGRLVTGPGCKRWKNGPVAPSSRASMAPRRRHLNKVNCHRNSNKVNCHRNSTDQHTTHLFFLSNTPSSFIFLMSDKSFKKQS